MISASHAAGPHVLSVRATGRRSAHGTPGRVALAAIFRLVNIFMRSLAVRLESCCGYKCFPTAKLLHIYPLFSCRELTLRARDVTAPA